MKKKNYRYEDFRKGLIIAGLLLVAIYFVAFVVRHYDIIISIFQSKINLEDIVSHYRSKTVINFFILIFLTSITAAIPFMSNVIFAIFNGVVYGPVIGFFMNLLSNIIGNFLFINLLGKVNIIDRETKLKSHLDELEKFKNKDLGLILGYMLPVMPTLLINYAVVEMKIPWRRWLLSVTIGVVPISLIYALGGDAIIDGNFKRIAILLVISLLVFFIAMYLKRRRKENK